MDAVDESSWNEVEEKPVIVRVKRKVGQSLLDAFWLEINESPLKRPALDFSKLYVSNSSEKLKPKKVLVRHLETLTYSETTAHIIHSFFESDLNEKSSSEGKLDKRKIAFKKDNRKEQRLTKAVQQQQTAAENARFEQIWRSRMEGIHEELHEKCHFYDFVRVDAEERLDNEPEFTSLEDQKMLASFLPLLRECIPIAAEEIEGDIHSRHTDEEYVYDFYAVNEEIDINEDSSKNQFPLFSVIVEDEEELCDGPEASDYVDSDDSNDEDYPGNDYPEEISEDDDDDDDDDEKSEASDESDEEKTSKGHVMRRVLGSENENENGCYRESNEEFEKH